MRLKSIYTLYLIEVPKIDYEGYMHFMDELPEMDVSDYDEETKELWIGISYETLEEQEKLLKKLKQTVKAYYE